MEVTFYMRKLFKFAALAFTMLVSILSLSLNAGAQALQPDSKGNVGVTLQQPASAEKIAEVKRDAVYQGSSHVGSRPDLNSVLSVSSVRLYYNIVHLYVDNFITSTSSFTQTSTDTVSLTLVQYPYGDRGKVKMFYYLVDASTGNKVTNSIAVSGNYTSSNTTIFWYNVPPGTYKVEILNGDSYDSADAAGNGYIN